MIFFDSPIFILLVGLCLGSFLNVIIYRLPRDLPLTTWSACPECKKKIPWSVNIPLFGYLFLRGKSRCCHKPIPFRYPLVEFLTALLLYASYLKEFSQGTFTAFWWMREAVMICCLVVITFIDLDFRIIPNEVNILLAFVGILGSFLPYGIGGGPSLLGAVLGFGGLYLISWLYYWRTGRNGMGGGDIKLLGAIGAFFGPWSLVTVLLIASILGSVYGLTAGYLQKRRKNPESSMLQTALPFGPFLVLGVLYHYFLSEVLAWPLYTIPI